MSSEKDIIDIVFRLDVLELAHGTPQQVRNSVTVPQFAQQEAKCYFTVCQADFDLYHRSLQQPLAADVDYRRYGGKRFFVYTN